MTTDWKKAFEDQEREHEAFKQKVTETAWQVAADQSWCDEGVADVLSDLDLPSARPTHNWKVTLVLEYHVIMEETEESEAEDEAMDALETKLGISVAHTFQTFYDEGSREWAVRVTGAETEEA